MLAKLQQRIDTDIDTLYRIVQELPGMNQTVFMTSQGEWTANQLQYFHDKGTFYMNNRIYMKATNNAALMRTEL